MAFVLVAWASTVWCSYSEWTQTKKCFRPVWNRIECNLPRSHTEIDESTEHKTRAQNHGYSAGCWSAEVDESTEQKNRAQKHRYSVLIIWISTLWVYECHRVSTNKDVFPPGFESGTFRVLGERDNHYTTETAGSAKALDLETWPQFLEHTQKFQIHDIILVFAQCWGWLKNKVIQNKS